MAASLRIVFWVVDAGDVPVAGLDLSGAGVIKISRNGAALANRAGAAPTGIGGGGYYYDCDPSEIPSTGLGGFVLLLVTPGGGNKTQFWRTDVSMLVIAYRTGRTVLGLLRRLGALVEGKATGINGTTPTFLQPDGATTEFSNTQDLGAGTRGTATVTNSENP